MISHPAPRADYFRRLMPTQSAITIRRGARAQRSVRARAPREEKASAVLQRGGSSAKRGARAICMRCCQVRVRVRKRRRVNAQRRAAVLRRRNDARTIEVWCVEDARVDAANQRCHAIQAAR